MAGLPPFAWSTTLRKAEETLAFCQKAAEFLRAVSKLKILDGQFIEARFEATDNVVVRHTLGRPYNGAFVVATSDSTGMPGVACFGSAYFAKAGGEPAKFLPLGANTSFTATVTVWVY